MHSSKIFLFSNKHLNPTWLPCVGERMAWSVDLRLIDLINYSVPCGVNICKLGSQGTDCTTYWHVNRKFDLNRFLHIQRLANALAWVSAEESTK